MTWKVVAEGGRRGYKALTAPRITAHDIASLEHRAVLRESVLLECKLAGGVVIFGMCEKKGTFWPEGVENIEKMRMMVR